MNEFPLDGSPEGNLLLHVVQAEQMLDDLPVKTAESTLAKQKIQEAQFWLTVHVQSLQEKAGQSE